METKTTKLPHSRVEIWFKVPTEEWAQYIKKSQTLAQAAEDLMRETYIAFLSRGEIEPIEPAQTQALQMVPGSPAEFKVLVSVLPETKLPDDYAQDLNKVERKPVRVGEKEVKEALESLRKSRAKLTDLDQPAVKGNLVTIEFSSPQLPSPSSHKDSFLLGQGQLIPGFEDQLVGLKKGAKKEFTLTYPETGSLSDLKGKPIEFKVEVLKVQQVDFPALDDRLAQEVGVKDLKELREVLKRNLLARREKEADEVFRSQLLAKIGETVKIEIPRVLIEAEQNRLLANLKKTVQKELKISFERYLQDTGKTEKEVLDSFLQLAEANVRHFLLLKAVGQKEKITVEAEELDKEVEKLVKTFSPEKQKTIDRAELKRYIKSSLLAEKVFKKLEEFWKKP